jgi:molybdate transport system substrate-binding protein
MMMVRRLSIALAAFSLGVLASACSGDPNTSVTRTVPSTVPGDVASSIPSTSSVSTSPITVFAASSVAELFDQMGVAFQAEQPGAAVSFAFGGSSDLAGQILQGAPVDVFASADQANMAKLVDGGQASGTPVVFAKNTMAIIVAPGNPKGITTLADLSNPDLVVVLGAPEVPAGQYAATVLENAGVAVTPKSFESNVQAVVTKVTAGEADAGIVFATDVKAAGSNAAGVEIPADVNVIAEYPIVMTTSSTNQPLATAFINFVMSPAGQKILADAGFLPV